MFAHLKSTLKSGWLWEVDKTRGIFDAAEIYFYYNLSFPRGKSMFYKPNHCSNCGEKIERIEWFPWTSQRFCEACEKDLKFYERLPQILMLVFLLFGIFGLGGFLRSGDKPLQVSKNENQVKPLTLAANKMQPAGVGNVQTTSETSKNATNVLPVQPQTVPLQPQKQVRKIDNLKVSESVPVYLCGAQTKKGTPCSRKMRGGGRCWQHEGQEAMLPPEELIVKR